MSGLVLEFDSGLAAAKAVPPLLSVTAVTVRYRSGSRDVTAVSDVSLDLAAGERLVLLGPSGCGKSTLLRAIGGFIRPATGHIELKGEAVLGPSPERMTVFQEFDQLLPWKTVEENVAYGLRRARGLPRAEAREVARNWIGRVGLADFAHAHPHTLSGGMKQRVAIARAFAIKPRLLLLDEPFAALDALTRRRMQDELLALCEDTQVTAIFVTHGIDEAIRVGTRILTFSPHPGRIIASHKVSDDERRRGSRAFAGLEARLQEKLFDGRDNADV
ncbi:ABC transporter ATP-binding protein [Radicibacter daui]|uniref:ABC transporter ATP-binding protein n=1 Tax=Radicibacter daui TaxID=3064829 RepID=UPI0040469AE3